MLQFSCKFSQPLYFPTSTSMSRSATSLALSIVLSSILSSVSSSPAPRNGDFDLSELMNKFLAEYESGANNDEVNEEPAAFEKHQDEIAFEPEPQPFPEPHFNHPEYPPQYYQQQQQYYQPPQQQYYQQE